MTYDIYITYTDNTTEKVKDVKKYTLQNFGTLWFPLNRKDIYVPLSSIKKLIIDDHSITSSG